ncbi:hypothetical protein WDW89_11530 [Deltaproteobacteria bacterium TL4]
MGTQSAFMQDLVKNGLSYSQIDTGQIGFEELNLNNILEQSLFNPRIMIEETGIEEIDVVFLATR